MLQLTPEQAQALEGIERTLLHQRLARHLSEQWPATADRLGPRLPAFIEFTTLAAERHKFCIALAALRYVNLCCVWGSAFDEKPGFEWARDLLADPRAHEWQKIHQLVRRSVERLAQRRDPSLPAADALQQADACLMQAFAGLGRFGRLLLREGVALPLAPCDLDLAAIRVTDAAPGFAYLLSDTGATRVPAPAGPPPLRVDAEHPAWPERIHVLARAAAADANARPTRLQLRTVAHAACDVGWHPHVAFAGAHGVSDWRGGEAKAISWPLDAPVHTSAVPTLLAAIAEQTAPDMARLQLTTCALREQGVPLGAGSVQVWTYGAAQWLLQLERSAPEVLHWPQHNTLAGHTRVAIERDGAALDATGWTQGFDALDAQLQSALVRLGAAWERSLGLEGAQLSATAGMLCGNGALAWGWQQPADDFAAPMLMQLQVWLELQALAIDLRCAGELRIAGAHAALRLQASGTAALRAQLVQRAPALSPPEALADTVARFSIPFTLAVDSLASANAVAMNLSSACTGALVGEAGLRPRTAGGSGLQWYAELRVEQVLVDVTLDDPLLGQTRQSLTLLPAMALLSWSLG